MAALTAKGGLMNRLLHIGLTIPMITVSILHIIQAYAILTDNVGTTTIIGLSENHPGDWVPIALGDTLLAVCYIVFALIALLGPIFPHMHFGWHILAWLPQQLLLAFASISALEAVTRGHYLDGVGTVESGIIISSQHILADQAIYILAAGAHLASFILWHLVVDMLLHQDERIAQRINEIGAEYLRATSGGGD